MKKTIAYATIAGAGFLVPVACGFVQMVLFNGQDSGWTHFLCYQLPYIVCPVWAMGDGSAFWFFAIPFLNAGTYAAIAFLWLEAKKAISN